MFLPEGTDPRILGQRLAEARRSRGATQEEVAAHLQCSRPTYIAMEKGDRPVKPEELVALAEYFGRRVSELVRAREPIGDFQPHLRAVAEKMRGEDRALLSEAIGEFHRLASDYRELEQLLRAPLSCSYPQEVTLETPVDAAELAETVAGRERFRLGLGEQPVEEVRRLLEWDVGLRVFCLPLPSAVAGMYAYTHDVGACVLVNRNHPAERRRVSMLHEYGHAMADRYKPGIDYVAAGGRKPANERFAEAFAIAFLMPATAVRRRFHEIVAATKDFQVADLCRMSNLFFVSVEAMAIRLEQLGLVPRGTWAVVKEAGFAARRAEALLDLPARREPTDVYPERYRFLAVKAFEQAEISQEQLARFLRCDPVTARQIVQESLISRVMDLEGREQSLCLEFPRSLLGQS